MFPEHSDIEENVGCRTRWESLASRKQAAQRFVHPFRTWPLSISISGYKTDEYARLYVGWCGEFVSRAR